MFWELQKVRFFGEEIGDSLAATVTDTPLQGLANGSLAHLVSRREIAS